MYYNIPFHDVPQNTYEGFRVFNGLRVSLSRNIEVNSAEKMATQCGNETFKNLVTSRKIRYDGFEMQEISILLYKLTIK